MEEACQEESFGSGEVFFRVGVRSPGESLSPGKGHSPGEAHFPSETHSVDATPQDVVLESYAAPFPGEEGYSPAYSRGREQMCWIAVELRDSQERCTVLQLGWPGRSRGR